jgi:uncharacterized protein
MQMMKISKIFRSLVPKDAKFLEMFENAADNIVKAAVLLNQLMIIDDAEKRLTFVKQIKECETAGDDITHTIFEELNKTFITPIDREDIQSLTSLLNDVLDYMNGTAQKIKLYKPKKLSPQFLEISDLILQAARQIQIAIIELKNIKNPFKIKEACVRINEIENLADDVYHFGISELFEHEKDAIELIKQKDILSTLEKATDKAEDVADVLKTIIVKIA